jgi:hypothetical protein
MSHQRTVACQQAEVYLLVKMHAGRGCMVHDYGAASVKALFHWHNVVVNPKQGLNRAVCG